jgi:hypothetical protein
MLIICACRIGRKRDAAQLVPALERLHACVPDGHANIMLCEHLFLQSARIVSLGENDYATLVSQAQQLIVVCNASGLQRALNVPFALEAVFERVISALQLAYDILRQDPAQRLEPQTYVLHHRVELGGTTLCN